MHFFSNHCCCHTGFNVKELCYSLISVQLIGLDCTGTHTLVWKPVFCMPIVFTYNPRIYFLPSRAFCEHTIVIHKKLIAQPFIKNAAPTVYTSGSQLQYLTPKVQVVFSLTRQIQSPGIPDPNQSLLEATIVKIKKIKINTQGPESGELLIYTHTQLDVLLFYPHFKRDRP